MTEKAFSILIGILAGIAILVLLATPARTPTTPPAPTTETTVPETTAPADALPRVSGILDSYVLDETAVAHCVYDDELHSVRGLTGAGKSSPAHALARLCDEQEMNPIAAFWLLTEEGLYRKDQDLTGTLSVPAFQVPETKVQEHPYTAEGVRSFLTELLTLSASLEDGLPLDTRVLGEDGTVEKQQVYLEQEECYYAYYVCYSPESAHFLCFYIRGGETITDVEFQLLNLRYADGDAEALSQLDQLFDRQASVLMAAAELLLTGDSRAAQGRIPLGYWLGDHAVYMERFSIVGSGDTGTLTNYRIYK